jgi:restriction system protein
VSETSSVVVFLDDHPWSIADHTRMLEKYGFTAFVCEGPMSFFTALEDWDSTYGEPKAIVVDWHLQGVNDLEAFGIASKRTPDGYGAGLTVVSNFLPTVQRFRDLPVILLTAFAEPGRVQEMSVEGRLPLRVLSKADPREFEAFIRSLLVEAPALPDFAFGAILQPGEKNRDGVAVKLIQPAYDRIVQLLVANPGLIYEIDARRWEEIIAASYENAGFDEVILTPRSGDLGRDVIATKHGFGSVKFIEQMKAFGPKHEVTANDVRALAGVLLLEQDVSKAIFTTTSHFAPLLRDDRLLKPLLPTRLELVDRATLVDRLSWKF